MQHKVLGPISLLICIVATYCIKKYVLRSGQTELRLYVPQTSAACTYRDFGSGLWLPKADSRLSFGNEPLYEESNETEASACRGYGDQRRHWDHRWAPSSPHCKMLILSSESINSCHDELVSNYSQKKKQRLKIHFVGDSHYYQMGLALKRSCEALGCRFDVTARQSMYLVRSPRTKLQPAAEVVEAVREADVLVLGVGHHYARGKKWPGYSDREIKDAARAAVFFILNYITAHFKGLAVVWNSYSPRHFDGGDWNTGGGCNMTADVPMSSPEDGISRSELQHISFWNQMLPQVQSLINYANPKFRFLINPITNMSSMRPGAHVGVFHGRPAMDCSHYCYPGIYDDWNMLMLSQLCNLAGE